MSQTSEFEYHMALAAIRMEQLIERDFRHEGGPVGYILAKAKEEAAAAYIALADVDARDEKAVRDIQNDIQRFRDLIKWLQEAVSTGREAWHRLNKEQQEEMADLFISEEEGQGS